MIAEYIQIVKYNHLISYNFKNAEEKSLGHKKRRLQSL